MTVPTSKGLWFIMAAGTGGHVLPGLSIAEELQKRGYTVRWLGTPHGLEQRLVPPSGIPLDVIPITGVRGKGWRRLLKAPWDICKATWYAIKLFRTHKPIGVLGMGGFVAGPGGIAAFLCQIPLLIHEQNAIAGLTNRLLKPISTKVMTAFPQTFAKSPKVVHTGNPIRPNIAGSAHVPSGSERLHLLVMGGSLGARAINDAVLNLQIQYPNLSLDIWHQTGKQDFERVTQMASTHHLSSRLSPFIEDMPQAYAWADIIIARAGAMTVFEIAAAGKASILIPFPQAVDDHQTANARYLSDIGAAVLLPQKQLSAQTLHQILIHWITTSQTYQHMAHKAKTHAILDATTQVANVCQSAMDTL